MIVTGTTTTSTTTTAPGLAGLNLLAELDREHQRLAFLREHTCHPAVPQGVAEAIDDAHHAIAAARKLQSDLCWGGAL